MGHRALPDLVVEEPVEEDRLLVLENKGAERKKGRRILGPAGDGLVRAAGVRWSCLGVAEPVLDLRGARTRQPDPRNRGDVAAHFWVVTCADQRLGADKFFGMEIWIEELWGDGEGGRRMGEYW